LLLGQTSCLSGITKELFWGYLGQTDAKEAKDVYCGDVDVPYDYIPGTFIELAFTDDTKHRAGGPEGDFD
jgi:hypothetical protein